MGARRFAIEFMITAQDKASAVLGTIRNGFADTAQIPQSFQDLGDKAGAALGNIVARLPEMTAEMFRLGASVEASENRFTKFAGGAQRAEQFLLAFQTATDGTVDRLGAMDGASKLLQMGLVENADQMGQVAAIATKLGDQTMGASDRISDFALLLANQSIPRLDNFGISSGKVRSRIIELQESIAGMTREAAFQQAVLEEGSKSLAVLGDTSELVSTKMDKITAAIEDAKIGFAEMLVSTVETTGGVDEFAARIRQIPETMGLIINVQQAWTTAMMEFLTGSGIQGGMLAFNETFKELSGHYDDVIVNSAGATSEIERYGNAIFDITTKTQESGAASTQYQDAIAGVYDVAVGSAAAHNQYEMAMASMVEQEAKAAEAAYTLRAAQEEAQIATDNLAITQNNLAAALVDATDAQIAQAAIGMLGNLAADGQISMEDYATAVKETQLAFGLATPESIKLAERLTTLTQQFADGTVSATAFDEELVKLATVTETEMLQVEKFGSTLAEANSVVVTGTDEQAAYSASVDLATIAVKENRDWIDRQREAQRAAEMAITDADIAFKEFTERLENAPEVIPITIKVDYVTSGSAPGLPSNVPGFAAGVDTMVGPGFGGPMAFVAGEGAAAERVMVQPVTNNNFTMNVTTGATADSVLGGFREMESLAQ